MNFCSQCGAPLDPNTKHVCPASEPTAAFEEVSVTTSTGAGATPAGNPWFTQFIEAIKLGIKNPDELSLWCETKGDIGTVIALYLIPAFLIGLLALEWTAKLFSLVQFALSGLLSGLVGDSGYGAMHPPYFAIFIKVFIVAALFSAAYSLSYMLLARLTTGKADFLAYFRALSAPGAAASLPLIAALILTPVSIYLGLIGFIIACMYGGYFAFATAKRMNGLSTVKLIYMLPLVQIIPFLLGYILIRIGL